MIQLGAGRPDEAAGSARRVLPGLTADQIQGMRIEREGRLVARVDRDRAIWRLVEPTAARADTSKVEAILSQVEFLERVRALEPGSNLRQLGLAPPAARLELILGTTRVTLELGRPDPSGQGVYLATRMSTEAHEGQGEPQLCVVERALLEALPLDADGLRDSALVPLEAGSVRSVEVERAGGRYRLERGTGGGWWLSEGRATAPVRAHPTQSAKIAAAVLALRARRFLRRAQQGATEVTVRITHGEEESAGGARGRLELRQGGPCPGHPGERQISVQGSAAPGGREPVVACVEVEDLAALATPVAELRDLAVTRLGEHELGELTIQPGDDPGRVVRLRREAGAWLLEGKLPADQPRIRRWVDALAALDATSEAAGADRLRQLGLDPAAASARVTLVQDRLSRREVIRIGPEVQGRRPLRRDLEPLVLWVGADPLARLLAVDALQLRARPAGADQGP